MHQQIIISHKLINNTIILFQHYITNKDPKLYLHINQFFKNKSNEDDLINSIIGIIRAISEDIHESHQDINELLNSIKEIDQSNTQINNDDSFGNLLNSGIRMENLTKHNQLLIINKIADKMINKTLIADEELIQETKTFDIMLIIFQSLYFIIYQSVSLNEIEEYNMWKIILISKQTSINKYKIKKKRFHYFYSEEIIAIYQKYHDSNPNKNDINGEEFVDY